VRIALATDAWTPQTNGVVTTLRATATTLTLLGHEVRIISPQGLATIACPSYPEIRLALSPGPYVARELKAFRPHAIHIATEGPLGLAVRRYCRARDVPFTTSYHTRYPEYLRARWPIPLAASYAWLRRFHGAAVRLDRAACVRAASQFSWQAATGQFLAGLAAIPLPLRARLAVSRSSAMIARMAARRQPSGAGDTH
jgi:hypothetical protein